MERNIVLIGMPGAGKSTIGVVLAKRLGFRFVDSDLVIQEEEGRRLYEIIEEQGIDGFLETENRVNAGLDIQRAVIATGGSAVYGREAMKHLKQTGIIIYLKLSLESVQDRLGDLNERGVVLREGQTLAGLYRERTPLYEACADMVIDCENKTIREAAEELERRIMQWDQPKGQP